MAYIRQRITIINISKPSESNINKELQWIGNSLGLFNMRDKDKSRFRLFIELLKSAKQNSPISSDELVEKLGITRGTVIHHLNKLMESGLVIHQRRRYILRVDILASLIEEVEKDFERTFDIIIEVAKDVDDKMKD